MCVSPHFSGLLQRKVLWWESCARAGPEGTEGGGVCHERYVREWVCGVWRWVWVLGEPPPSHCVMCVPTYIVCSIVELGGVCEVRREMGQQREELLREMELLRTELTGKLHVWAHVCKVLESVHICRHVYRCACVCYVYIEPSVRVLLWVLFFTAANRCCAETELPWRESGFAWHSHPAPSEWTGLPLTEDGQRGDTVKR